MADNKTGKYLKYALGEILLVMIGILLALQVNNWNEGRKTNEFETKLLQEIYANTKKNISHVKLSITRESMFEASCELLLNYFDENLKYHDSLDVHFNNAIRWRTLYLDNSAYETAKSYGLHIIKKDTLRKLLTKTYEFDQLWIDNMTKRQYDYHFNTITPMLIDFFEISTNLSPKLVPLDYDSLKENKAIINILKTNAINRGRSVDYLRSMLKSQMDLEQMLKAELTIDK
jgi:hypothetical protein